MGSIAGSKKLKRQMAPMFWGINRKEKRFVITVRPGSHAKNNSIPSAVLLRDTLKKVKMFMEKINNIDPEAIVVFQADHGLLSKEIAESLELTEKEKYQLSGKIFNAIKAPEICFDKFGLPKTNVNTMRFALNCAYGFKLPYRKNIHYKTSSWGTVVEKIIYE